MKKISKLLALAASVSTLFFLSCSDADTGSVSEGVNNQTNNAKDYSISFAAADGTNIDLSTFGIESASNSRSIVASNQKLDGYKFYLWGKDVVTNSDLAAQEVTFTADDTDTTKGKVTLDLKVSNYKLVLAAVKTALNPIPSDTSEISGKALYIGYANVDLRNTSSIKFYITSDGLTGEGSFKLTVMYDGLTTANPAGTWTEDHVNLVKGASAGTSGTDPNYVVTADILSRSTGSSQLAAASSVSITDFFGTGAMVSGTVSTPGTYNFVVYFKDALNGNKVYEYSDIIIILPNQEVEATVKVPDVIEYVPATPLDLKVGYVTPATDDIGTYNAVLSWTDNSNNESYFEVEIVDVSRNSGTKDYVLSNTTATPSIITEDIKTAPATGKESDPTDTGNVASLAAWEAAVANTVTADKVTYGKDFYGDAANGWVAGSLQRNNNHIVVKLSLGKSYVMRIAAVNDAGKSRTYAYATYDLSETWTDTDPIHSGTYKAEPFALKELNFDAATPFAYSGTDTKFSEPYKAITDKYGFTANLYRLIYNLNGGTLTVKSGVTTTKKVVCYLTQSPEDGIPILAPYRRDVTGITPAVAQEYPMLINNGNRWTSWRKDVVEGDPYDATTPTTDNNITYYKPANYAGFANLNLFASFAVSQAAVEAYLDRMYDFIDGEIAIDSLTTIGAEVNAHAAVVYNGTTTVKLKYTFNPSLSVDIEGSATSITRPTFTYSSLFAFIKTANSTDQNEYARADFSTGATGAECALNIGNLAANKKYQITVIGEYNGHQYSYPIIVQLQDRP